MIIFSYDELNIWASDKCTPLVREITFENAEELTEEGLPFLILFHHPDDNESIKQFTDVVQSQLLEDKRKSFYVQGLKFKTKTTKRDQPSLLLLTFSLNL